MNNPLRLTHLLRCLFMAFTLWLASCAGGPSKEVVDQLANDDRPPFGANYAFPVKTMEFPEGRQMAYTDQGEGEEVLIFVHGLGGYSKHWEPMISQLKHHYRCIAPDLPGYGYSDRQYIPEKNILAFYAEAILQLADHLKIGQFTLVGHSMGGQTAMVAALTYPGRIRHLVLAAPAGFETFSFAEATGMRTFATASFFGQQDEAALRAGFEANFTGNHPMLNELLEDRIRMREQQGFEAYCHTVEMGVKGMLERPVWDELNLITCPVLVLFGENDALIPNRAFHPNLTSTEVAEGGTARLPNGQLVLFPGAGHLFTIEQADLLADAIMRFLQEPTTSAGS